MKAHYRRGGLGDGTCKKFLFNVLEETLAPIREAVSYTHLDVYKRQVVEHVLLIEAHRRRSPQLIPHACLLYTSRCV